MFCFEKKSGSKIDFDAKVKSEHYEFFLSLDTLMSDKNICQIER